MKLPSSGKSSTTYECCLLTFYDYISETKLSFINVVKTRHVLHTCIDDVCYIFCSYKLHLDVSVDSSFAKTNTANIRQNMNIRITLAIKLKPVMHVHE